MAFNPSVLQIGQSLLRIVGALALVALAFFAYVLAVTTMPGSSLNGPLPALTAQQEQLSARLRGHVSILAASERNVQHIEQLEAAAMYLETQLASLGLAVRRQEFLTSGKTVRNLEVTIPSKAFAGQRVLVVGAHYDSAAGTPGANDNATGAAAVLELARQLKDIGETATADLVLVLYTNEESPYFRTPQMGSRVHAKEMKAKGAKVVGMLSLETMGYFSDRPGSQKYPWPLSAIYPAQGNFIGFVGSTFDLPFVRQAIKSFRSHATVPSEGIAAPRFVPGIDFSDHAAYMDEGYSALMVTDTAPYRYPYYHSSQDTPDKVDFDRLARVVQGLDHVIREIVQTL